MFRQSFQTLHTEKSEEEPTGTLLKAALKEIQTPSYRYYKVVYINVKKVHPREYVVLLVH